MGKCKFNNAWLKLNDNAGFKISSWAARHSDSEMYCKICLSVVNVQKGFQAVTQHASSSKHKKIANSTLGEHQMQLVAQESEVSLNSSSKSVLGLVDVKKNCLKAEIVWSMKVVSSNYSAASCQDIGSLFQTIFPSEISNNFSLSPAKFHYMLTDGIAPYFREEMLDEAQCSFYSISYDETTNVEDRKELQVLVRYWSNNLNKVVTRHLETIFIGKADGETLFSKLEHILMRANLSVSKLIMISSDGPNVNKKVFRLMNERVLEVRSKSLIDIGTCNIHIVHNAYLKSMEEFGENASDLLLSVYYYFDGWPSRFQEFEEVQKRLNAPSHKFIKHSPSRWLTFCYAAERLLEQWDCVNEYFLKYIPKNKNKSVIQSPSYRKIVSYLQNSNMKCMLYFTISSASIFTKFTQFFQREEPTIHLLYSELKILIKTLLGRILKKDAILAVCSGKIIEDIDDFFQQKNMLPFNQIVLSDDIQREMNSMSETDIKLFLMSVRAHYKTAIKHLLKKTSFNNKLVKSLRFLRPEERTTERSCRDLHVVAKALPIAIPEDTLLDEWKLIQLEKVEPMSRIDTYWSQFLDKKNNLGESKYPNISQVIKMAFTLWHGQADVERSFSISRWALTEDKSAMSERTLNAILIVKDAIKQFKHPHLVPITVKLLKSGENAHKNYINYLNNLKEEKRKIEKEKEEREDMKRKLDEHKKILKEKELDIERCERELKIKKKEQAKTKGNAQTLFNEASERLKKALKSNNLKEAALAQAMLEAVSKLQYEENATTKEIDKLEINLSKRKNCIISDCVKKIKL